MELCANSIALRDYEDRMDREEKQHEVAHPAALAQAINTAREILENPVLMTEAVDESADSTATTTALCILFMPSTSEDDKRNARHVVVDAIANYARWSSEHFVQRTLTRLDDDAIAKAILKVLP